MTILVLPLAQAYFIWYCAWLSIPSALYAYSIPTISHLAIIPAAVFTTSVLYWRIPRRDSWQRKLDITVVISGLSYNSYYVYSSEAIPISTKQIYSTLIGISGMCYAFSEYLIRCGRIWPATYAHASIHLFANIANIILYNSLER
jgi:hypothetical protein